MSLALPLGRQRVVGARSGTTLAALDLGTSKIACFIATAGPGGGLALLGRGLQSAEGLERGEIVDLEAAEAAVRAVLQEAEEQAGLTVETVVAAVGAGQPRSILLEVERPLGGRTVDESDLEAALARARDEVVGKGLAVLHLVAIEARVDGGRPVVDPRGLEGRTLALLVHVVAAEREPLLAVMRCLERCHLSVRGLVAAPYAAGLGCLTEDERERGCLLVDIGADATQVAHFAGGRLLHVDRVELGGERITHDVAWGLSTTRREAERIKNLYGAVVWRACDDHVRIELRQLGDGNEVATGEVPRTRLTTIVRARVVEIFDALGARLRENGAILRARPPRALVLTGGAAQLEGMDELAQETFGLPTRIGRPRGLSSGLRSDEDPGLSAVLGALAFGRDGGGGTPLPTFDGRRGVGDRLGRFRAWFRQNF
ncbi:MAG: cell division protein FtsA [Geminicoccaceae bacterium]|jgi:cell division protein FtsA|nr:MAG: cell division protein FtsA [Geminicoccaceae bacterium]